VSAPYLLDASAVLALLGNEAGKDRVEELLAQGNCHISAVNYQEVMFRLVRVGMPDREAQKAIDSLGMVILSYTPALAQDTSLAAIGFKLGLSLGDRCCLTTALQAGMIALTTEQEWKKVKVSELKIEVIR